MRKTKQTKTTMKSKPKKGKVVRLAPDTIRLLKEYRGPGISWDDALRIYVETVKGEESASMWTLPSKLFPSEAEARGLALVECARAGLPPSHKEIPIAVRESK